MLLRPRVDIGASSPLARAGHASCDDAVGMPAGRDDRSAGRPSEPTQVRRGTTPRGIGPDFVPSRGNPLVSSRSRTAVRRRGDLAYSGHHELYDYRPLDVPRHSRRPSAAPRSPTARPLGASRRVDRIALVERRPRGRPDRVASALVARTGDRGLTAGVRHLFSEHTPPAVPLDGRCFFCPRPAGGYTRAAGPHRRCRAEHRAPHAARSAGLSGRHGGDGPTQRGARTG